MNAVLQSAITRTRGEYRILKTMTITRLLILVPFFIFTPLLIIGCSKMSAEEAQIRMDFPSIPSGMPIENLGEIEFISGSPKNIDLADHQSLAITATSQADDTIQISLEYESTKQAAGVFKKSYTEQSRFLIKPGMRCAPELGEDVAIVFSAKIIEAAGETLP